MRACRLTRRSLLAAATAVPAAPALLRAQPLRQVDLLIDWRPAPTYAGVYIARDTGAFERRGLDVRIVEGHGASVAAEMVGTSKEYWISTSSAAATAIGRSKNLPIRSLAVYYRRTPTVLYSRAEDRIDAPRDLIGKRVGLVPGSVTIDEFRALLAANRIDRSRIREVDVDWSPRPLLDGKVDALIDYEEITPAELIAQGRKIAVLRFADYGVRFYSLNLIVNEMAWLEPERQAIGRKIAEAVQEGYQLVRERPADAAALYGKAFPDLAPRYLDVAMPIVSRQLALPIGSQTRLGWEDTLKALSSLGLLARAVSAEEVAIFD